MVRWILSVLLLVALLLPQVWASSGAVDDPANDEQAYAIVAATEIGLPATLGCHDPAADILHASLGSNGTSLAVALDVRDVLAPPTCTPLGGLGVAFHRDTLYARGVLLGPAGNIAVTAFSSGSTVTTRWTVCLPTGCFAGGPVTAPLSSAFRWTVPLTGSHPCGGNATCAYDLRGATFNASFDAGTQAFGTLALSGEALSDIRFADDASLGAFTTSSS